jgi:DNA repair exonuclease SbcCD ATPase subunit
MEGLQQNLEQVFSKISNSEIDQPQGPKHVKAEVDKIREIIKKEPRVALEELAKLHLELCYEHMRLEVQVLEYRKMAQDAIHENKKYIDDLIKVSSQKQSLEELSRLFEKKYKEIHKELKEKSNENLKKEDEKDRLIENFQLLLDEKTVGQKMRTLAMELKEKEKLNANLQKQLETQAEFHHNQAKKLQASLTEKDDKLKEAVQNMKVWMNKFMEIEDGLKKSQELFLLFKRDLNENEAEIQRLKEEKDFLGKELSISEKRNVMLVKRLE